MVFFPYLSLYNLQCAEAPRKVRFDYTLHTMQLMQCKLTKGKLIYKYNRCTPQRVSHKKGF